MSKDFKQFDIIDNRGRELTRLGGDVMFYMDIPLSERRDELAETMEGFYKLCPRNDLRWYLTETMKQFKPATARSFSMPKVWWKDGAPRKDLRQLWLKDGPAHNSLQTCGVSFSSAERKDPSFALESNYIRFVVPAELMNERYEMFLDFVVAACNRLSPFCGHGGFVIDCNPYYNNDAEGAAYPLGMRYQAVDIATKSAGPWAVRGERIKNVGWLTIIGAGLLKKIGGLSALKKRASDRLSVIETAHGALVRAGERPILGDTHRREKLDALRDAYELLVPLQDGIADLFAHFDLPGGVDEVDATKRWLFRFAKK